MLYELLYSRYGVDTPIFSKDVLVEGRSHQSILTELAGLAKEGKIKRYSRGVYYIPKASAFRSGSVLSRDKIVEGKYLVEEGRVIGYLTGLMLANNAGLTTQVPMTLEVATNNASRGSRKISIGKSHIILIKPKTTITSENADILQVLDLIEEAEDVSEVEPVEASILIRRYAEVIGVTFGGLAKYIDFYPTKTYKALFQVGVRNGWILT